MRNQGNEYKDYKFLTREEEIAAWERGDRDALVESVWPFVLKMIRKLASNDDFIYNELVSEAGFMLAHSVRNYDARQSRFITYSCQHLKYQLVQVLNRNRTRKERISTISDIAFQWVAAPAIVDKLELDETKDDFREVATALQQACTVNEYEVFARRAQGETFREIGEQIGFTRQRAQQLFEAAKAKARELFPSLVESGD